MDDVKKAVEGLTSHKEDVDQFVDDIENLRRLYHLNSNEVQQVWMTALAGNWHHVRGNWNPRDDQGNVIEHDAQLLRDRVDGLIRWARQRFQRRANYTEIGRVKQKDDESFDEYKIRMTKTFKAHSGLADDGEEDGAFQQQLKNALHAGSKDSVHSWVQKHYIGLPIK